MAAQNVPKEVMEDFDATNAGLKPLKLARNNCARPDQNRTNRARMLMQDKEVSAFLYKSRLARLI